VQGVLAEDLAIRNAPLARAIEVLKYKHPELVQRDGHNLRPREALKTRCLSQYGVLRLAFPRSHVPGTVRIAHDVAMTLKRQVSAFTDMTHLHQFRSRIWTTPFTDMTHPAPS